MSVYNDSNRRSCIVIGRDKSSISIVKLDTSTGLCITQISAKEFDDKYSEIKGYPINKAIEQYAEFARYCGASQDVVDAFNEILDDCSKKVDVDLTRLKLQQVKLLDKKQENLQGSSSADDDCPPWDVDDEPSNVSKAKKEKTKMAKQPKTSIKVPSSPAAKNTGELKQSRRTAASVFKDLILTGQYSDDEIFTTVQKEFGLDDSKRSYVSYYRRELKNKGLI